MLKASIGKNDKLANRSIIVVSVVVFLVVAFLSRITPPAFPFSFDVHVFAAINAIINSMVTILLGAALIAVLRKSYLLHKRLMVVAIVLSVLFLVFYILHHLYAGDTKFGDVNHDNIVDAAEIAAVGKVRYFYYFILITHIILAAIILPFILFTAYRGLTAEYGKHKKVARWAWPIWFYVALTGVLVYLLISPYYV